MNKFAFIVLILLTSFQIFFNVTEAQQAQDAAVQAQTININTATLEKLILLPGIGKSKAAAIIQFREDFGPFEDIEDLLEVKGIGQKMLTRLEGKITL